MKALREFFIVLLSMLLVGMITSLGLFISFRSMVNMSLAGEIVEKVIMSESGMTEEDKQRIEDSINKIKSYEGTQEVIDSFLNDVNRSPDGNIVVSDETIDKFVKALEDNKKDLVNLGIPEDDIDRLIAETKDPNNREEIQKGINEGYKELGVETDDSSFNLVKSYSSIASPDSITKLGISIGVVVLLIALLSWSVYKWIRPTSISSIIAGINLLAVYYGIDMILKMVTSENGVNFELDTSVLKTISWSVFIGGIVALIVYIIINTIVKRVKNKSEGIPNKSLKDIHTKVTFTTPNNTTIVSESVTTETKVVTNDTPTESAPINPDKYCPACGGGLTKDATVCSHCGAPLD